MPEVDRRVVMIFAMIFAMHVPCGGEMGSRRDGISCRVEAGWGGAGRYSVSLATFGLPA